MFELYLAREKTGGVTSGLVLVVGLVVAGVN
jgi:hypothetical protein